MNPRNTAILALLVAALGAFLYFYEIRGEDERSRAEEAQKRVFPGIEAEQLTAIELRTSDDELARLEREEGAWRLRAPLEFRADEFAADGLASTLAELSSEAVFEQPEPLEEYGLTGDPKARFWVGDAEYELRVGDKTPVGGNTYVASADASRVFAVTSWRVNALSKSVQELRDARVLDFDRSVVRGIRARWPGGSVELSKAEDGWRLDQPLQAPADEGEVEALLSTLQFLRAEGFEDAPPSDAEAGLDAPVFAAELTLEEGAPPVELVVGGSPDGEARLVRGRAEGTLYRIPESRLEDFPRTVTAYRFKELASFSTDEAQRFELVFQEGDERLEVSGEKDEAGWKTSPEAMAAGKASRLVAELAALEAVDIAADAMGDAERAALGLNPPRVAMRVFGADEDAPVLADVRLGVAEAGRGVAAQRAGEETVYWLDFELGEHVPVSLEAFRNRFVSQEAAEPDEAAREAESAGEDAPAQSEAPSSP